MNKRQQIPERFIDRVASMPEYSYGVNRIVVTLKNGQRFSNVFVAGHGLIVKVGVNTMIPFNPREIINVECQ